jgi:hypothetical protein
LAIFVFVGEDDLLRSLANAACASGRKVVSSQEVARQLARDHGYDETESLEHVYQLVRKLKNAAVAGKVEQLRRWGPGPSLWTMPGTGVEMDGWNPIRNPLESFEDCVFGTSRRHFARRKPRLRGFVMGAASRSL